MLLPVSVEWKYLFLECNRLVHDVGFTDILSELHFNREYFHAQTIPRENSLLSLWWKSPTCAHKYHSVC